MLGNIVEFACPALYTSFENLRAYKPSGLSLQLSFQKVVVDKQGSERRAITAGTTPRSSRKFVAYLVNTAKKKG